MSWICYSAQDSISTLSLWKSLKEKLVERVWLFPGVENRSMYDFYEEYSHPFGDLLVQKEFEGFLVDRKYLSMIKKLLSERLVMLLLLNVKYLRLTL